MRVLLRVVVVPALIAGTLAGCSRFDAALGQQQAIVSFKPGTTVAEKLKIRATCGSLPNVKTTPVGDLKKYPYSLTQLTYRVDNASDADIARLEVCLSKFNAFAGLTMQDSSDDGS